MRRIINPTGALLGLWLAAVAILAALGAVAVIRLNQASAPPAAITTVPISVALDHNEGATVRFPLYSIVALSHRDPGVQWGNVATATVAGLLLVLMMAVVLLGRRGGLGGRPTLRLLTVAGLTAVAGAVVVALVAPLAAHTGWTGDDAWLTAAVLLLTGCALLAVRATAGRVAVLSKELDGVI